MNRRILLCLVLALAAVATVGCKDSAAPSKDPQGKTAGNPKTVEKPKAGEEAKRRQEETAGKLKIPVEMTLQVGKGVTMKLALIPAGHFMMGSPATEKHRQKDEGPQRRVTITKPFYMGVTEVTQGQWKAVMGTEPWNAKLYSKSGADNAATYVNWGAATPFCEKLSKKAGRTVRLPTEAEWEYACRAGSKTTYCFGDDPSKLGDYAWYGHNAIDKDEKYAHRVAVKKPNAWGLHDMHGNVSEWCQDWHNENYYSAKENASDPTGPTYGTVRVLRGGSWRLKARSCRSAFRTWFPPDGDRFQGLYVYVGSFGFRAVSPVPAPTPTK